MGCILRSGNVWLVMGMVWVVMMTTHSAHAAAMTDLVLGAVLPLSNNVLGDSASITSIRLALDLAVERVNQNYLNALDYNLTVVYRDSHVDQKQALFAAIDICTTYANVIGLVGELYSFTAVQVAYVGELYKVPVISPSATEDILSNKTEFPYFMRLVQPDSQQAVTMAKLIFDYGWTRYAIISTTDTYGTYGAAAFKNAASALGLTLLAATTLSVDETDYSTQVQTIANSGAKIIVIFALSTPSVQILDEADKQGLVGNGYVWIGSDGVASLNENTLNSTNDLDLKTNLKNLVATAPYTSGNPSDIQANTSFSFYAMFMYDIPFVFASAIQKMTTDGVTFIGNGPNTLSYLYRTNIIGVTGNITFDKNGDRIGLYEVLQWSEATYAFVSLGPWPDDQTVPQISFAGNFTPTDDPLSGVVKLGFYVSVSRQSSIYATVKLAVDRINQNNTIPGVSVALVTKTQTTSAQAIVDATDLIAEHVVGVLGPSTSDVCKPVAQMLGVLKVPQLSFAATTSYLSDKLEVPYFIRNVAPDSAQVTFFNVILAQYGWKRIGFLYTVESYGSDGYQYYQNDIAISHPEIQIVAAVSFLSDATSLASEMQVFKDQGVRVILTMVSTTLCTLMLSQIVQNAMIEGYVWIHSDSCAQTNKVTNPDFFASNPDVAANMPGMLGIVPFKGAGAEYNKLIQDITNSNITYLNYTGSTANILSTNPYTIYAYDSAWIFADALRQMVISGQDYKNGALLLAQLYKTNYSGVSGLTAFNENGDRLAPYSLLNWRASGDQDYTPIGYWNPVESGTIQMSPGYSEDDVVWLGGATTVPSDSFKHSKQSTLAIVLSVVLVALGVGVIILLALLYISRRKRREVEETLAEPWNEHEYPRDSYDLLAIVEGFLVTKRKLDFGLSSTYRFPVDTKLKDYITLTNNNGNTQFTFYVPENEDRFICKAYPGSGVIKNGESIEVTIEFTLLCTTDVDRLIKLKLVEGNKTHYIYIQIFFEGEMSDILDPDELEIKEPLGTGGFGTVYKGIYRGTEVAIKTMNHQLLASDIAEFNKELGIMRKLKHNNIVTFVAASQIPHKRCLVTEYCKYGSLGKFMAANKTISFQFKMRVALDIAQAMNFLHSNGVWHRDLKPDNVLIVSRNIDSVVVAKITDFGTSRSVTAMHQNQMHNHTLGLGTPIYMAPEILERQPYNNKIDVYSYGVLLWALLTQQTPYYFIEMHWDIFPYVVSGRRNPIPPDTPSGFAALISSCWARSPDNRPTFQAIITLLENMILSDPLFKRAPSLREFMTDSSDSTSNSATVNSITGNSISIDISSPPNQDTSGENSRNNTNNNTSNSENNNILRPSDPPTVTRRLSDNFTNLLEITKLKTLSKDKGKEKEKDKSKMKQKKSNAHLLGSSDSVSSSSPSSSPSHSSMKK